MFLRISTVKRKNKSYNYAQIVQSYRRKEDGLPAHKVVANLGQMTELEIHNLKNAFEASRTNKKTYVSKVLRQPAVKLSKPCKNLVFLDLMVLIEIWRQSGIDKLLASCMFENSSGFPLESIIAILCLHRCQDPGSKLSATRWYGTTALPELIKIPKAKFNNTRIHRALYCLEQATMSLMGKLPKLYNHPNENGSALFLDISDAWFCGQGPSMAKNGISKDGVIRKKIGILLLCNKEGLPLRWHVVPGSATDNVTMYETLDEIKKFSWVQGVPLVCDRAMGRSSMLEKMYSQGIHFLTALTRTEYLNYAKELFQFENFRVSEDLDENNLVIAARDAIAQNKSFVQVSDDMFSTDLGFVDVCIAGEQSDYGRMKKYSGNRITAAMAMGREIKRLVADGEYGSFSAAGKALGLKTSLTCKYNSLNRLPLDIQEEILSGTANNCSINKICEIAVNMPPEKMVEAFYRHVEQSNRAPVNPHRKFETETKGAPKRNQFRVRIVAYFNPQMYANQKIRAKLWLVKAENFTEDLNRRLSSANSRRTKDSIFAEIDRFIRKKDLLRCFDIKIYETKIKNRMSFRVELNLLSDEWAKRRQFDGFCILASHPDCKLTAPELCRLYREKDVVEKDFQTIKNVLKLRPVRHRNDEKVRAHVTICMLSLLLERLLQKKLAGKFSVAEALETLHPCHLNKYKSDDESLYTITETDSKQNKILSQLNMTYLADDDYLLERMTK